MTAFRARVATLAGVAEDKLERLAGGDLSEVFLVPRHSGDQVAKGGSAVGVEAAMLRFLSSSGVKVPAVEGEYEQVLLLEHVPNDGVFSPRAWASIGAEVRKLHQIEGERFGWPVDYNLGTIKLHNQETLDWPQFWGEQRLKSTARLLDRPWRERVEQLVGRLPELIPASPAVRLLHGDLWSGNILVKDSGLQAFIDPACYFGHSEVDLAMLSLFGSPAEEFWHAYGALEEGAEERLPVYQLFPALVHLRLFGAAYASMVDRLLTTIGF